MQALPPKLWRAEGAIQRCARSARWRQSPNQTLNSPIFKSGCRHPFEHGLRRCPVMAGDRGREKCARVVRRLVHRPILARKVEGPGTIMLDFEHEPRGVAQMELVALALRRGEPRRDIVAIAGKARIIR